MSPSNTSQYFFSDATFDSLFPVYIQNLSAIHWTPLDVAVVAARFLAPDAGARIIDIGAGVGKFCIAGAAATKGTFTGIEKRKKFVLNGNKAIKQLDLKNVTLLHGNFTDMDISTYTGVYFFNSFHENIVPSDSLDNETDISPDLYYKYSEHLFSQLSNMPVGTRLATYWLSTNEIPGCYTLCESHFNNLLKLWEKKRE